MAGYSGTPLAQKLGLKPGLRVHARDMPPAVRRGLQEAFASCDEKPTARGPLDWIHVFVHQRRALEAGLDRWKAALVPAGRLWVSWPKRASGVATDVTEDLVRDIALAHGLVDVKVCAVDDTWSGLLLVRRLKDR